MGRWNRRYLPRTKKFRHYEWEEDQDRSDSFAYSDALANGILSWEVDYCRSAKVPWNKIVASKRYIYCYPSVLNWDASAGQEALENAKEQYLATVDGRLCDNQLPDREMYIDEIDWNPVMDFELMKEIDLLHCDPDKAQEDEKPDAIDEGTECYQLRKNPWEGNHERATLKDALNTWGTWDDSVKTKRDLSYAQDGWKTGNESCDKPQAPSSFNDLSKKNETSEQEEDWGCRQNDSLSWNHGKPTASGSSHNAGNEPSDKQRRPSSFFDHGCGSRKNETWASRRQHGKPGTDGSGYNNGWRDHDKNASWIKRETDESWVWHEAGDRRNNRTEPWGLNSRSRDIPVLGRQFHDSYRKRERSFQQTSKHHSTIHG